MDIKNFTDKQTTKEQYLKFKAYIKANKHLDHWVYVAYYIFKHRLTGDEREQYLNDEIKRCHKGLYSGRIVGIGGDWMESHTIPLFKNWVIRTFNEYAEDGEGKE